LDLKSYFSLSQFICPLEADCVTDAYRKLLEVMKNKKILSKKDEIVSQLLEADESAFNIRPGVSIPHLRIKKINDIMLSVGFSHTGIVNLSGKGKTHLFFLELIPAGDSEEHIYFLSEMAKLVGRISIIKLISEVMTSSDLYSKLNQEYDSIGDR
jgi:PTS system nitrogen regulatory IIA component